MYEITCKEKTWFAYSNKEKDDIVATLQGKKYDVQRSKGLGENEPEMMWLTTKQSGNERLMGAMALPRGSERPVKQQLRLNSGYLLLR